MKGALQVEYAIAASVLLFVASAGLALVPQHEYYVYDRAREQVLDAAAREWCAAVDRAAWVDGMNTSASVPAIALGNPVTLRFEQQLVSVDNGFASALCAYHAANVSYAGSGPPFTLVAGDYRLVNNGGGTVVVYNA